MKVKISEAIEKTAKTTLTAPHALHPEDTAEFSRAHMDWLPDWKNAAAYPPPGTSNAEWAWELLRRNRYFQRDCLAAKTEKAQATVAKTWRLPEFKPYWQSYADGTINSATPPQSEAHGGNASLITKTTFRGPNKLLLELNPEALASSAADRDRQFILLRELIEKNNRPEALKASSAPRTSWGSKIGKYLRVADALSLKAPVARQIIGEQLHRELLILIAERQTRSDDEVAADLQSNNLSDLIEDDLIRNRARQATLAKKYSREIGSQISRAYNLIYADGYSLLWGSDTTTTTGKSTYKKKRKPFADLWGGTPDEAKPTKVSSNTGSDPASW